MVVRCMFRIMVIVEEADPVVYKIAAQPSD
jgi:hypothetical protein